MQEACASELGAGTLMPIIACKLGCLAHCLLLVREREIWSCMLHLISCIQRGDVGFVRDQVGERRECVWLRDVLCSRERQEWLAVSALHSWTV